MSQKDQLKWDKKYIENEALLTRITPSDIVTKYANRISGTRALDIACGIGRNALYLAKNGFEVDALDISAVALQELTQHMKQITDVAKIHTKLVDLDEYDLTANEYDLIIMINFLDRDIIRQFGKSLKKGGLAIVETYMRDEHNEKKNSNPDFLLAKDELLTFFGDKFETIEYGELWVDSEIHRMKKQMIIVRKISS